MRVLVAYASPQGSTRGVAERIGSRLLASGVGADCLPVHQAPAVDGYDAVVVGSALHGRAWLPEASEFVRTQADGLRRQPVWLFSVGMPGALARPLRRLAMREGATAVAPFADLVRPRDTHLFSGVVTRQTFPPVSRAVLRLMGAHYGDFRDWAEIDAWADGICEAVRGLPSAGPRSGTER